MTNNLPSWIRPGEIIEFAFAVGEIVDVATSNERVMILVTSPKGIWRNHPAEWLEYKEGAIKPATRERAQRDIELYREYIKKMLVELDQMQSKWLEASAFKEILNLIGSQLDAKRPF